MTASTAPLWYYRAKTVLQSLKALYTLPPEKVDAFLNSYNIYDHDWADEKQLIQNMGEEYYREVQKKLVDYYSVLNHLCSLGHVEKMYIPPAMDLSKNILENQTLFERKMARDLRLQAGQKALDIGCGRGRIAAHIASYTGAHVTGINLDPNQLETARRYAQAHHIAAEFRQWDLNHYPYPFADQSLDAVYHVQVFSLCKDLDAEFREIYRILKPGGRFACLDWLRLDAYDPKNKTHATLMSRVKPLIGAIGTPSIGEYEASMRRAGFKVTVNENASLDGLQAPLIENADKYFNRLKRWVDRLVGLKLMPAHFKPLLDRLTKDGEAFVQADRMRLCTTSHYFVAEKPL